MDWTMPSRGKKAFDSGVSDLWSLLDSLGDTVDRRALLGLAAVRRELVDRLLALPSYSAEPGGPEVVHPSSLFLYLGEVERVLSAWTAASAPHSADAAADLATSGYTNLLRELAGLPPQGPGRGIIGLTPDLVTAVTNYRSTALGGLAATITRDIAAEMQGIIFGTKTRWDAVRAIRAALAGGDDGLGRHTAAATRIERTALMTVFNAAGARALTAAEEEIPGLMKEWSAADQPRTCPKCKALDGQRREPKGVFGEGLGSPPAHWNCRCRLVAWAPGWED